MKSFSKFADINFAFCFFGILRLKEQIEEMLDHIKTGLGLKLQGGNFFFFFFLFPQRFLKVSHKSGMNQNWHNVIVSRKNIQIKT